MSEILAQSAAGSHRCGQANLPLLQRLIARQAHRDYKQDTPNGTFILAL